MATQIDNELNFRAILVRCLLINAMASVTSAAAATHRVVMGRDRQWQGVAGEGVLLV